MSPAPPTAADLLAPRHPSVTSALAPASASNAHLQARPPLPPNHVKPASHDSHVPVAPMHPVVPKAAAPYPPPSASALASASATVARTPSSKSSSSSAAPPPNERRPSVIKRMFTGAKAVPPSTDDLSSSVQSMSISPQSHSQQSQSPSRASSVRRSEQAPTSHASSPSGRDQLTAAALAHLEAPAAAAAAARERNQARKDGVRAPLSVATGRSVKEKHKGSDTKSNASTTLRDMILGGPKLSRRGSSASGGSKATGSKAANGVGDTASLLKKYGVCEKAAIGKGATAVVRLAHKWDRSTEKLYAVKEFRKRRKNETEKEYVKKLTSEFCISSTLHHINIVETVDLVQDENKHWCEVMEFCVGGDLYAAIKRGGLSQREVECYFKQTIKGIFYLHSMGVAHQDIKPENLLLDAEGRVKITDFGVSDVFRMCWMPDVSLSTGLCGSEPYIAPEQFEHKKYDARLVDCWAAAIVFYCMQFQELPWRVAKMSDPTFNEFVHTYHSASSPGPAAHVAPRECRPLLKRMLCPDPQQRCTVDDILKDKWFISIDSCGIDLSRSHKHNIVPTIPPT